MANTLTQAGYLCTDMIKKGIIDTIINESPFLARMPFIEVDGNSYLYNLESAASPANWYSANETIVEGTPVWAQRSVTLCELMADADVDKFIQQTRSKDQDIKAAVIEKAGKAMAQEAESKFIRGYTSTTYSTKEPKGLMHLLAETYSSSTTTWDAATNTGNLKAANATSGELTLDLADQLVDLVKPGKPDCLMLSRRMRRKFNTLARASGTNLSVTQDEWGKFIEIYNGIPMIICDYIPDNILDASSSVTTIRSWVQATTRASAVDNSVIFALKWGEQGICGVQNGGITYEDLGTLESKDAERTRIKWYVAMANFSRYSLCGLTNVLDTALT
jgi:HK97 family phage major capsid protein